MEKVFVFLFIVLDIGLNIFIVVNFKLFEFFIVFSWVFCVFRFEVDLLKVLLGFILFFIIWIFLFKFWEDFKIFLDFFVIILIVDFV